MSNGGPIELRKSPLPDVPDEILERHARTLATKKFIHGNNFVAYVNPHYVSIHSDSIDMDVNVKHLDEGSLSTATP